MCLLIVLSRAHPDAPLVVAANRDEWLARPATPCAVLQERGPRIVGGRDELAGGTWLALNEHGLFAGLTNRPTPERDASLRSRGELPLALAQHRRARDAVEDFAARFSPRHYSPAWLFVGDRDALFLLDMTGGERPAVRELAPGLHVLENRAFGAPSAKVEAVRAAAQGASLARGDALVARLAEVLRDHRVPDGPAGDSGVAGFVRPPETEANCVHAGPYGTRSASILVVPPAPATPRLWVSEGPPCTHPLSEQSALLRAS